MVLLLLLYEVPKPIAREGKKMNQVKKRLDNLYQLLETLTDDYSTNQEYILNLQWAITVIETIASRLFL
jgi:hypothetical protein